MKFCPKCKREYENLSTVCDVDGNRLSLPDLYNMLGTTLMGKYRIDAMLGTGGMGAVYEALHRDIDRRVAVKILHPHFTVSNPAIARNFKREARAAGRISHPNAISVTDFGVTETGLSFMVMELLEGLTLEKEIQRNGRLSMKRVLHITRQVCDALTVAHNQSVIHRDLKPANIILMEQPQLDMVKVVDFGIAKLKDEGSLISSVIGTPRYSSPEQFRAGGHIDERSDIYSLAIIVYEMLSGQTPFDGRSLEELITRQLTEKPRSLAELMPELPVKVDQVIQRAMEKNPKDRQQTIADFYNELEAASEAPVVQTSLVLVAPAGCEVYVDDERKGSVGGSGRLIIRGINNGKHTVRVSLKGLTDWEHPFVAGGKDIKITARIKGGPAPMRDSATPSAFTLVPNADGNIISDKTLAGGMPSIGLDNTNGNGNGHGRKSSTISVVQPIRTDRNGKPDKGMVVIPSGTFQMGSTDGNPDERPVHTVNISNFLLDAVPVTNAEFAAFVVSTNYQTQGERDGDESTWRTFYGGDRDNYPVVWVNWQDAFEYARWAGKRLPTEAEWEYAARGGLDGKRYPWGDDLDPSRANYNHRRNPWMVWSVEVALKSLKPVRSFEPNAYNLYDMAGNVWEWCSDWYGRNYYSATPQNDPPGPAKGPGRVLRGGSWSNTDVRVAYRLNSGPEYRNLYVGFRCAKDI